VEFLAMTQTPTNPTKPRGKRPHLEAQPPLEMPLQQTAGYAPPAPAGPKR